MFNLNEICNAFAVIIDIAANRTYDHSRRTAYMATRIAEEINYDRSYAFYSGLLHDIGASGELSKYSLAEIHNRRNLIFDHAHLGAEILASIPFLENLSEIVKYHHEEYNGQGPYKLTKNEIPLGAKILYLADQIDLIIDGNNPNSDIKRIIADWFNQNLGKTIDPLFKTPFLKLTSTEKFWLDLEKSNLDYSIAQVQPAPKYIQLEEGELFAKACSNLIDDKSGFTHTHSVNVNKIAVSLAKKLDYDNLKTKQIGIAAYLHDIGKLIIPNEILEKNDSLNPEEFSLIRQHTYYTKKILMQIKGMEQIAQWAANHHEKINGKGYPEGLREISEEDQLIAFADIYTALTEDRPYRKTLPHERAIQIINDMVDKEELHPIHMKKFIALMK